MKIKTGDNIMVLAGKDSGKKGMIIKALPKDSKVVVSGINMSKHHLKPSRKSPHGGIIDMPTPIQISNVIVVCPHCGRPTRVSYKIIGNPPAGGKERICRKCQGNLDTVAVKEKK